MRLWECGHRANLTLAKPVGITAAEPWSLVSNLDPSLDLVWAWLTDTTARPVAKERVSADWVGE